MTNKIIVKCELCKISFETTEKRLTLGRGKFCSKSCRAKSCVTKHGHTTVSSMSRTYNTWANMKQRCNNKNHPKYKSYGNVGIKVCKEWYLFQNFLNDMGERPDNKTIDRIDGNLGYYKENCRWATPSEQSNNIKTNKIINYNGEQIKINDLAIKLNIKKSILYYRAVVRGWPESEWIK